jgi:hypothetical protein
VWARRWDAAGAGERVMRADPRLDRHRPKIEDVVVTVSALRHNQCMEEIRFTLLVTGPDPDDLDDIYDASRSLRSDLQEVSDLRVSEVLTGQSEEGTRSGILMEALADGGLGLTVVIYGGKIVRGIFQDIVTAIRNWQERNKGKQVILKDTDGKSIELRDLSGEEALSVLETFMANNRRHPNGAGEE